MTLDAIAKPRPRDEAERALVLDQIAALWLGQSQRQIARKLSLNAGTVSGLIMRARRRGDARFPARPDPTPRVKPPPRPRPLKPRDETAGNVRPPKPIPFLLLRPGMCKFPLSRPAGGSWRNHGLLWGSDRTAWSGLLLHVR